MSARPIAPSPALARLIDEGYEVEVRAAHLLVHSVPYVTAAGVVQHGTLVCTYIESGGVLQPPDNHQVWFTGEYPCLASGARLSALENEHNRQELFDGCTIQHRFSNKPEGLSNFADHRKRPANPSWRRECWSGRRGRLPVMRQEFGDAAGGLRRQPLEDVAHVGVGVDPVELGRVDQAHDCSGAFARAQ